MPWADAIYACDRTWWQENAKAVREACTGEFWTINQAAAKTEGLNLIGSERGAGVSRMANTVMEGGNSGYQAIGLALLFGASRIVLLGYDMQFTGGRKHWHPDHRRSNPTHVAMGGWVKNFNLLASQSPVPIINCSRETALRCFPRVSLDEGLAGTA